MTNFQGNLFNHKKSYKKIKKTSLFIKKRNFINNILKINEKIITFNKNNSNLCNYYLKSNLIIIKKRKFMIFL